MARAGFPLTRPRGTAYPRPVIVIVMGVSGSGKSTVGQEMARRLGWEFRDGDAFHPPANVAKMASGTPLTDADREPWLRAIQQFMRAHHAAGGSAVIACSALRASHRQLLLKDEPWVRFVFLSGSPALIDARLRGRQGHFMPPTLLASQLATLEPPEGVLTVDITPPPEVIAAHVILQLGLQ